MWEKVGAGFAISEDEFATYTAGASEVTALEVAEPCRLQRPASAIELASIAPDFALPQSVACLRSPRARRHLDRLGR